MVRIDGTSARLTPSHSVHTTGISMSRVFLVRENSLHRTSSSTSMVEEDHGHGHAMMVRRKVLCTSVQGCSGRSSTATGIPMAAGAILLETVIILR